MQVVVAEQEGDGIGALSFEVDYVDEVGQYLTSGHGRVGVEVVAEKDDVCVGVCVYDVEPVRESVYVTNGYCRSEGVVAHDCYGFSVRCKDSDFTGRCQ